MGIQIAELRRLSLLIQRLLDAEILPEEDRRAVLQVATVILNPPDAGELPC